MKNIKKQLIYLIAVFSVLTATFLSAFSNFHTSSAQAVTLPATFNKALLEHDIDFLMKGFESSYTFDISFSDYDLHEDFETNVQPLVDLISLDLDSLKINDEGLPVIDKDSALKFKIPTTGLITFCVYKNVDGIDKSYYVRYFHSNETDLTVELTLEYFVKSGLSAESGASHAIQWIDFVSSSETLTFTHNDYYVGVKNVFYWFPIRDMLRFDNGFIIDYNNYSDGSDLYGHSYWQFYKYNYEKILSGAYASDLIYNIPFTNELNAYITQENLNLKLIASTISYFIDDGIYEFFSTNGNGAPFVYATATINSYSIDSPTLPAPPNSSSASDSSASDSGERIGWLDDFFSGIGINGLTLALQVIILTVIILVVIKILKSK